MNKPIKYISFYDIAGYEAEDRYVTQSAVNTVNYISQSIVKSGKNVEIISPAWTKKKRGLYKKRVCAVGENITLRIFSTFGAGNPITRYSRSLWSYFLLFLFLLTNTQKGETIIVYHAGYAQIVRLAKKIKKFIVILEVEEIYSDVTGEKRFRKQEYKMFKAADAFILSTHLLNHKINENNKPFIIKNGSFNIEPDRNVRFDDGKIHCVYAGTFDPRKGGAAAAAAAAFLDDNYHIHILGFGTETQKSYLLNTITDISQKTKCRLTFDGLLKGEEYIRFIQRCHIGLSTQTPDAQYNDTSFPSKVLSYMANGLRVVSIKIPALEQSDIADDLFFYDEDTPEAIADTIKRIDLSDSYNGREVVNRLDSRFRKEFADLLNIHMEE